jgi:hypothetical protein
VKSEGFRQQQLYVRTISRSIALHRLVPPTSPASPEHRFQSVVVRIARGRGALGCEKTTPLKTLFDVLAPSAGSMSLDKCCEQLPGDAPRRLRVSGPAAR